MIMNEAQPDLTTNHQRAHSMPAGSFYNSQVSQQREGLFTSKRRQTVGTEDALLFGLTQIHVPIYQQDQSTLCQIELGCKVDRGFFISNQHWTCYRRNYFQLTGAFTTHCNENQVFYIQAQQRNSTGDGDNNDEESNDTMLMIPLQAFYIQLVANTSDNNQPVELIQLTAKRDKGPQQMPSMLPIQPCGSGLLLHYSHDNSQQQRTVTFERLQFKSATANNGKKRATQQYFYLTAQLVAEDVNRYQHVIATTQSSPLVVRGRSPGHYAEMNQRLQRQLPATTLKSINKRKKVNAQVIKKTTKDTNTPLSPSSLSPIPMASSSNENNSQQQQPSPTLSPPKPSNRSISSSSLSSVLTHSTIITPTIPSDAATPTPSMYYLPPSFNAHHGRSFSANDSAWQRQHPYHPYHQPPPPPPSSYQQRPSDAWGGIHMVPTSWMDRQRTYTTYVTPEGSIPSSSSSSSFARYSPPKQEDHHHHQSDSVEKQDNPTTTTYMLYPNTPWDARHHDPYSQGEPKQQ